MCWCAWTALAARYPGGPTGAPDDMRRFVCLEVSRYKGRGVFPGGPTGAPAVPPPRRPRPRRQRLLSPLARRPLVCSAAAVGGEGQAVTRGHGEGASRRVNGTCRAPLRWGGWCAWMGRDEGISRRANGDRTCAGAIAMGVGVPRCKQRLTVYRSFQAGVQRHLQGGRMEGGGVGVPGWASDGSSRRAQGAPAGRRCGRAPGAPSPAGLGPPRP